MPQDNTRLVAHTDPPPAAAEQPVLEQALARLEHAPWAVAVVHLAPGASLPRPPTGHGQEVLVLAGRWTTPDGPLERLGYARSADGWGEEDRALEASVLFVRTGPFEPQDADTLQLNSTPGDWVAGHGNLRVRPLHAVGSEGTALVLWPRGERFVPHQHWGGEEIFVVDGTFLDEHGTYPRGTWLLSPHRSTHHPYVEDETLIFVKTGHLPQT